MSKTNYFMDFVEVIEAADSDVSFDMYDMAKFYAAIMKEVSVRLEDLFSDGDPPDSTTTDISVS